METLFAISIILALFGFAISIEIKNQKRFKREEERRERFMTSVENIEKYLRGEDIG